MIKIIEDDVLLSRGAVEEFTRHDSSLGLPGRIKTEVKMGGRSTSKEKINEYLMSYNEVKISIHRLWK